MAVRHFHLNSLAEVHSMAAYLSGHFANPANTISGLFELLLNAIEHGNLEIGFAKKTQLLAQGIWAEEVNARQRDPHYAGRHVRIELREHGDKNEVVIADEGPGFDWAHYVKALPKHDLSHGRGLYIAQHCGFDRVEFNATGNTVVCIASAAKRKA